MKKRTLLTALLGMAAAAVAKRKKAQQAERDLWTEAGQGPEHR